MNKTFVLFQTHLPGYVEKAADLNKAGAAVVACVAVNDAFVMSEWGKAAGADGKVRMLADPCAEFTKVSLYCCNWCLEMSVSC